MSDRTQTLPVKLTPEEISVRAQQLATSEETLSEAETRLEAFIEAAKETKKGIEIEITMARSEVGRLARIVRNRTEPRDVAVHDILDFTNQTVRTFRSDTDELIATRGMTPEERQRPIQFAPPAVADEAS